MCCLGFLALECGATKEDIHNTRVPDDIGGRWNSPIPPTREKFFELFKEVETSHISKLMVTNDHVIGAPGDEGPYGIEVTSEEDREAKLKELFAKAGIEVEFVD